MWTRQSVTPHFDVPAGSRPVQIQSVAACIYHPSHVSFLFQPLSCCYFSASLFGASLRARRLIALILRLSQMGLGGVWQPVVQGNELVPGLHHVPYGACVDSNHHFYQVSRPNGFTNPVCLKYLCLYQIIVINLCIADHRAQGINHAPSVIPPTYILPPDMDYPSPSSTM